MKRVIVLGASGFFGRLILERLSAAGLQPIPASRSWGELRIDANSAEDIRANLRQRDLVVDAAGPFQRRTPALIDAAKTIGFDVVDISDSPEYAAMVYEREAPVSAAGIRVLTACSALSAVSAVVVKASGIEQPRRLRAYLLPASRNTANPATILSFLSGVEGQARTIRFAGPLGDRSGITVKSVDAITLPRAFPSLAATELIVDSGRPYANALLRSRFVRGLIERHHVTALKLIRRIGATSGVLAFEVSSALRHKQQIFRGEKSYMLAVIPAIEAAIAIAGGKFKLRGVVPPSEHVGVDELYDAVKREGIESIRP
ncbi:MAG TPA: hypothetical protein VMS98_06460 [Thermoanaerobaculia bacterium]|nr:hypothetical protein [Thermoanaerobaculia bacterium]